MLGPKILRNTEEKGIKIVNSRKLQRKLEGKYLQLLLNLFEGT